MNTETRLQTGQRGATVVEFAIVVSALFMLLIGIMEMGRMLFYWNTASEATRLGARLAVVCDLDDSDIKSRMISRFPGQPSLLTPGDIQISYWPAGCTAANCELVTAQINPKTLTPRIPFVSISLTLPAFATTLSRESMQSSFGGSANPVCM
jgi:hypothetical protein